MYFPIGSLDDITIDDAAIETAIDIIEFTMHKRALAGHLIVSIVSDSY